MIRMHPWVPGPGFVFIVCTVLGASTFFGWGLRTPPLDTAWGTQIRLQLGDANLTKVEIAQFQDVLHRHPGVAHNILEGREAGLVSAHDNGYVDSGYAYLVRRSPEHSPILRVSAPRGLTEDALKVRVRTVGSKEKKEVAPGETLEIRLPSTGPFPQLIEVELGNKKTRKKRLPALVQLAHEGESSP